MAPDTTQTEHLFEPGSAAPLGRYTRSLWSLRAFIVEKARGDIAAANSRMSLGNLWLLIDPAMFVAIYYVIFSVILDASRGVENFILFLAVGRLGFRHHRGGLIGAATSIPRNLNAIRTSNVPRAVLPIAAATGAFLRWGFIMTVIYLVAIVTGQPPSLRWLLLVPAGVGVYALNMGLGMTLAPLVDRVRDLQNTLPIAMRMSFYATGAMFPIESYLQQYESSDLLFGLLMLNPIYGYVKIMQWAMLDYSVGRPGLAALVSIAWTCLFLPLGLAVFVRHERALGSFKFASGS